MQTLNHLAAEFHKLSREKGWYESGEGVNIPEKLLMIHSEISEAVDAHRNSQPYEWTTEAGKPEGLAIELADALIRILDLCGALQIDIAAAVERKHIYNMTRPYRHGNKRI